MPNRETGPYDVSPDRRPVIGRVSDRVVVDAGTSGQGFKLAPALGRVVADLALGLPVPDGVRRFHPDRFDTGVTLGDGPPDRLRLGRRLP